MPVEIPAAARSASATDPGRGALMMIGSCAAFAVMMAMVRLVSADIHPFQAAFFRNLLGLLLLSPWLLTAGAGALRTGRMSIHLLRATFGLSAMLCLFYALSRMPLSEVTALTFTAPLFATAGAALILRERVRLRRWTATVIGFLGAMIVLRPGSEALQPVALIALASAAFIAGAMLSIKSLSRTEHPNAIVIIMGLLMTPASLIPAAFVWTWPSTETWGWLMVMGVAATAGQMLLTRALAAADASAVLPYDFSRLVFVSVLAYAIFGEIPDAWTWIGAVVILAATGYIAHRERPVLLRSGP
jgi:drug/metabolite transporter (DMT)-like permease